MILTSTIVCPLCGFEKPEPMPENACVHSYECTRCHQLLYPRAGDCCVFCSYGSVRCPPRQLEAGTAKPATKVAFGILGTLSLVFGFVATLLGAAAWFLSHQRTGTEGLAVIAAVFFQWVAALVGGYILGVPALRQRSRAARLGVFLSVASVVLTALALILHYASSG